MSSRVAVLGLGRSGVAAARALVSAGWSVLVLDQAKAGSPGLDRARVGLQAEGIEVLTGWDRPLRDSGAGIVVTSPGVSMRNELLLDAVDHGLEVITEVELAYRLSRAPIVAVTGTNGKSTTTVMTWLGLKGAGCDAVLCGNIYGSGYDEVPLAEAAAASTPEQVLVAEVSSFQLEWVLEFRPVAAAITNITPDHLDRYEGFDEYASVKHRIFAAQKGADTAVVPLGHPFVVPPDRPMVKTFGSIHSDARTEGESLWARGWAVPRSSLPFVEPHNLLNAQVAMLLGDSVLPSTGRAGFASGLARFSGLAHRLQKVGERDGVRIVNNSMCTNPAAVLASSAAIGGERRHLLVGGRTKSLDFSPLRALLEDGVTRLYLFGSGAAGIDAAVGGGCPVFETMAQAFAASTEEAGSGDVVMLAPGCASTDQFEDFRARGEAFSKMAREWLER